MEGKCCDAAQANRMAFGGWLILAGLLMLAGTFGLLDVHGIGRLWPLLLVAFGVARLVTGRSAYWLLVVGVWFSVGIFTDYDAGDTWPLLLVAVGGKLIWDAFAGGSRSRSDAEAPHA